MAALDTAPHVRYALHLLSSPLPMSAVSLDAMRVTAVYFALHTLDVCRALPALPPARACAIAAWLRACLCDGPSGCGFAGHPCLAPPAAAPGHAHVACTYAAVCSLRILGARAGAAGGALLQALPSARIAAALRALQQARCGGVASSAACEGEVDVRFLYSAAALCQLLGLRVAWGEGREAGADADEGGEGEGQAPAALLGPAALRYLAACQTHEGGFALALGGGEAHGAATYCALAAWALLHAGAQRAGARAARAAAAAAALDVGALRRWLALRAGAAGGGVSGRAGKGGDACYTWWVGASLVLLREVEGGEGSGGGGGGAAAAARALPPLLQAPLLQWLQQCAGSGGLGFGKDPEAEADPFHTVFALAGVALGLEEEALAAAAAAGAGAGAGARPQQLQLAPVVAALGLTQRALSAEQ